MIKNIKINNSTKKIKMNKEDRTLGVKGENKYETLKFKFEDNFLDGEGILEIQKPNSQKEYIILEKEEDCYLLEVKNSLLNFEGEIIMQLVVRMADNKVFKSVEFSMQVLKAIEATTEIPDEYETWDSTLATKILEIDNKLEEVTDLEEDLENKVQSGYFKGDKGDTGDPGQDGEDGDDGKSAYEIWLDEGNVGTEEDFLESLKGENGTDGEDGQDGQDGRTPVKGTDYWTTQDKQEIVTDVETDLQPTITAIQNTANTAVSLAKLANQAKSYPTYQAFINYLNTAEKTEFIPGQSFMIQTKLIPDLWVYSVENTSVQYTYTTDEDFITYTNQATGGQVGYYKLAQLETQKVDLANYYTNTQTDTLLNAKVNKSSFAYDSNTETLTITMS